MVETIASYWYVIVILLAGGVASWLSWPGSSGPLRLDPPKIEPSAPKAVVDVAREMPKATEPVAMVAGTPIAKPKAAAAPKAKAAPAAKPKTDAPAKKPAVSAPKAKAEAPKAKAEPAKKAAAAAPAKKVPATKAKAEPKVKAEPKAKVAAKPKAVAPKAAAKPVIPDNLELLKGVGPKLNTLLKSLGITSFEQVANWSGADIAEIDSKLGTFAGRISRDNWVDQAKLLVAGDIKGFEKKYGSLGSEITG
jgi:predicted flap endonuclease-1-like 5' DNA nuclease